MSLQQFELLDQNPITANSYIQKYGDRKTVFIFPGNTDHHGAGVTLYSHKGGAGLAGVAAALGRKNVATLSLPTTGMNSGNTAIGESAIADLWRAVGFGMTLVLPVRKHTNKRYFSKPLTTKDLECEFEPSFWGGLEPTTNLKLANYYLSELQTLYDFCNGITQHLPSDYKKFYAEGQNAKKALEVEVEAAQHQITQSLAKKSDFFQNYSWYSVRKQPVKSVQQITKNSEEKSDFSQKDHWDSLSKQFLTKKSVVKILKNAGIFSIIVSPGILALAGESTSTEPEKFLLASGDIKIEEIDFGSFNYVTFLLAIITTYAIYKAIDELIEYVSNAKKDAAQQTAAQSSQLAPTVVRSGDREAKSDRESKASIEQLNSGETSLEDGKLKPNWVEAKLLNAISASQYKVKKLLTSGGLPLVLTGATSAGLLGGGVWGHKFPGLGGNVAVGDLMIATMVAQALFLLINLVVKWHEPKQVKDSEVISSQAQLPDC